MIGKCKTCKNYSALREPRKATEECYIHGYCFKDFMKNGRTSSYPVYIPDAVCESFVKTVGLVKTDSDVQYQLSITDFPEVLP